MITLSIGIPAYERPDLLKRVLNSIITQVEIDQFNIEILIGDDSKKNNYNHLTEIKKILPDNITLDYLHHEISKGQNENVASLIGRAKGDFFCLMHDDDYFLEGTIKTLINEAKKNPYCIIFGKQLVLVKEFDYERSKKGNADYQRSAEFAGKQKNSVVMAMLQQCPNDGFILETSFAKKLGYRSPKLSGTACDFDFALRAAVVEKLNFIYLDQYTTVYSVLENSVTNSFNNDATEKMLKILCEFETDKAHPEVFHEIMKAHLSMVISYYISMQNYNEARKRLLSFKNFSNYLWYKPATYLQFLKILFTK